jgi:hypothetical protein
MLHTGVLTATLGTAAVAIWAGGDLGVAERVLVFVLGGVVIALDVAVVFLQVGRDFMPRSAQLVTRNVVPAQSRPAVATVAVSNEPPA